jgi:hypothetical protein
MVGFVLVYSKKNLDFKNLESGFKTKATTY